MIEIEFIQQVSTPSTACLQMMGWLSFHLNAGWRESSITWDLQAFCAREENEYEIVVPLRDGIVTDQAGG